MAEQPIHLVDAGASQVAYLPSAAAVVSGLPRIGPVPGNKPSQVLPKEALQAAQGGVIPWGESNDLPQKIILQASKSTIIPRALTDTATLWRGGGLIASADEESVKMVADREIKQFLGSISMQRYLLEACLDMAWWWNCFPEFILSRDRKKIVQLHNNETADCRWAKPNKNGELDTVLINADWANGASADDEATIRIPAVNPYRYDLVDWIRSQKNVYKYVYPISFPSPGKAHYQLAAWDSARSSGWLDVLEAIPLFKKYGLQNQMTLRYHIEVPSEYWEKVYGDKWRNATDEGKKIIRDEFLKGLMDSLTDVKNAHKAVLTESWIGYGTDTTPRGIIINVLDDKIKDGKYNLDMAEGTSHLLYALGVDPTLFGFSSAGVNSTNGGSNKREAFWIFLSKAGPYRDRILEPLRIVAEYNGWYDRYPDLTFSFKDTILTTLDTGASTAEVTTPAAK
ncbi:hypothetical protein [Fibrella forsythiae]|uniref:Uncharacterized protein n=1 Tax=Fibrella forsythiae TaxID=2817061 RepID=A0ABS3JAB9_9BACT|nr:hypothetical protein [Fibrella forsythiae]MBO0946945.1 hypothetical protein [Fibrella forsythiae]